MNKNRIHTMIKTSNTETTLRFEWPQFFPLRPLFELGMQTKNFMRIKRCIYESLIDEELSLL